ncbi:MAG: hypothetical protein JO022_16210 [Acidobacteriaceae bacterium]|nr:hypothetical protein [Acidobacteriaceae bacterium]
MKFVSIPRHPGKLLILFVLSLTLLQVACIGRQPMQQGTWSGQDGFKNKSTDQAGHSPENPERG